MVVFFAFALLSMYSFAQDEAPKKKATPKAKTAPEVKEIKKANEPSAAKPKVKGKVYKGQVISLNRLVLNGKGTINKAEAEQEAQEGKPIVLMVGSGKNAKIYFVFNEDGSFAGKRLAKFADNKNVGVVGVAKVVNGINIIVAQMIESMD